MSTELVLIGFGNIISADKAVAFLSPNQQPIKRLIREARDKGLLIDATHGRKAKSVIVFDTGHVALASVTPETISNRLSEARGEVKDRCELAGEEVAI